MYELLVYIINLIDIMRRKKERKKRVLCPVKKNTHNQQCKVKRIDYYYLVDLCFCSADLKSVFLSIFSARLWFLLHFNCQ